MRHLLLLFVCALVLISSNETAAQEDKDSQTALPVSAAHALFGKQCGLCHEPFKGAPEQLCLKCHDGPLHAATQTVTPPCISCHVEHKGQEKLAKVANEQCVTCHKELQVKNSTPVFAKKITGFVQDHPEFALSLKSGIGIKRLRLNETGGNKSDRTTLTFPHDVHLKAGLKSPKGQVQLACKDCHATAEDGKQIAPIVYEKHCQSCHQLAFSPDTPNVFAPHAEPSVVHGFLVATFAERRATAPPPPTPTPDLPAGRLTRPVPSLSPIITAPTSGQSVAAAEKYLYTVTCNKCHVVENPQARIPTIARVAIPKVWLPHGLFSHRSHRLLECASCHADVTNSKTATDVNLPSIRVCQECHRATTAAVEPMSQHSATTDCASCHVYHDKTKDDEWLGNFTVQRVLTEGAGTKSVGQQSPKKK